MSFDGAIKALSADALKLVKDGQILGLGSGRAATMFVTLLSKLLETKKINLSCVPTSLQIKLIAEKGNIPLIEADQTNKIDIIFDGADQIDSHKFLIKGGGGALLRENILTSMAKKVVIMADSSKFVKNLNYSIPVEIHPFARNAVTQNILKLDGIPQIRSLDRGYPFITENGNIILDCDFGIIKNPRMLRQKIISLPGVIECGIFTRKPDIIYKAKNNNKFDIIS